jgi:hypothetical protein
VIVEIVMKTFCNYCRKATETKDGDCVDCKLSKVPQKESALGMWCRMCGGECDLENCGMEQP